jgi:hypothetical protein
LLAIACLLKTGNIKALLDESGTLREGGKEEDLSKIQRQKLRGGYVINKHCRGWRADLKPYGFVKEFEDLIKRSWDEAPEKRPTFTEIVRIADTFEHEAFSKAKEGKKF